jgi:Peroxisomal membrane protein (Pex16)
MNTDKKTLDAQQDQASALNGTHSSFSAAAPPTCVQSGLNVGTVWQVYQKWVRANPTQLWIWDELIARLLVWTPSWSSSSGSSNSSRWRQAGFGLLDLHRLLVDVALSTQPSPSNAFGMSVTPPPLLDDGSGEETAARAAVCIRLGLSVLQNIVPVALELVRSSSPPSTTTTEARLATVRRNVERARFLLRLALLVPYWRRIANWSRGHSSGGENAGGVLLRGGLYHAPPGIPWQQEQSIRERCNYVGRRTGLRLVRAEAAAVAATPSTFWSIRWPDRWISSKVRTILAELLYIVRPLLQAECNDHTASWSRQFKVWAFCLAVDLASLVAVPSSAGSAAVGGRPAQVRSTAVSLSLDNPVTVQEMQRRQWRLLLYLLRAPVWECYTEPSVQSVTGIMAKIPLVGGLLHNYIWDWLYYWQLYRSEEG